MSAPLRILFAAPSCLYRWHLGWLFGHRFLVLSYRGRRTGRTRRTVLEVIRYDPIIRESVVMSAYGPKAAWYLSILSAPALRVETGHLDYVPRQRLLTPPERLEVIEAFCREHPLEARLAPRVLPWIGAAGHRSMNPAQLLASLPMVAFCPPDD